MSARFRAVLSLIAAVSLAIALAGCSSSGGLAPGLVARVDATGAKLDTEAALSLINHLRASQGAPALVRDTTLEQNAQTIAADYARTGASPKAPEGVPVILTSAGYLTFAETFSGWRGSQKNTATLSDPNLKRAGLAVTWAPSAEYGSYWVLLLAP